MHGLNALINANLVTFYFNIKDNLDEFINSGLGLCMKCSNSISNKKLFFRLLKRWL